jgi:eukaryotic-like serine/threonine-protein kinase
LSGDQIGASMIKSQLSHYTLSESLGAGGMGVVYLATDARLNRRLALKVLADDVSADPQRKQRFVREARAASALSHPNIVTIYDVGEGHRLHRHGTGVGPVP